jgi:tRNA1(Val) A37 N6-methylase TrmN6
MRMDETFNKAFTQGLQRLGFSGDDVLFLVDSQKELPDPQIKFHLEDAKRMKATAVYLRRQLNGSYKPQVYIFDFTNKSFTEQNENEISQIQKEIWSSGIAPLACVFYNTEIKIIDCTTHITDNFKPEYLVDSLTLTGQAHALYNEQFAVKIKSGIFWDQEEVKDKFAFRNSSYDALISNIGTVTKILKKELKDTQSELINKIIIQSILIKYLEERIDNNGNKLLSEKYFQRYKQSASVSDVLCSGCFSDLLKDLDRDFNGNVFKWEDTEINQLKILDLSIVADLLATDKTDVVSPQNELDFDWRYFEFKYIPVELISRLYEEFLGKNKKENGLYYTPSHLVKLLIDECLPLKQYSDFILKNLCILDPACGSGIFLVVAFKRLVQIWRLQNDLKHPDIETLKSLLSNLYGVDKEEQAIQLSAFSLCLALCNELEPVEIINNLRFDDLRENNLNYSDFFTCDKIKDKKFDLVIGNPPFARGATSNYSNKWKVENKTVSIPQGQIALKFLSESFSNLKDSGLVCLIVKSSGLLYNSTSTKYKKVLFSKYNVVQILDFTALARNKTLWENGADVASAAIFVKNEKPDFTKNILHLTFKRTKATRERIIFEIDDYDLHFIDRQTAINNEFIWKINLLGGGRIRQLVEKVKLLPTLKQFLSVNNCIAGEGYIVGKNGTLSEDFIYRLKTLPTGAISQKGIDYSQLTSIDEKLKFVKIGKEELFSAPNIIAWENIGIDKLPIFYNDISFSFKDKLFAIASTDKNIILLKNIAQSIEKYSAFYRFYIFITSSQLLVNLNTALLKTDIMQLRFIYDDNNITFTDVEKNIINDVINFSQDFIRHGEKSKAVCQINSKNIESIIQNYGDEFSNSLNAMYKKNNRQFRLSDIVELDNSLIAAVFKYDSGTSKTKFHKDLSSLNNIEGLTTNIISSNFSINRIIKLYPQKDMIVFVKPNQYRYWISLTAYRDADKCISDFSKAGL